MARPIKALPFGVLIASCAASPTPSSGPAPEVVAAVPTDTPPPLTDELTAQPELQRHPAEALAKVEEGRAIQRQRGEGGAADAIAAYEEALLLDPLCGAALWEIGWSYQVLDDLDKAKQTWDRLREMDPAYPELDIHYPVLVMRHQQKAVLAALPDPDMLPAPEEVPRTGPTITIAAVGDVHLGRAWPESRATLPPNDAKDMFTAVEADLKNADVTFGNLETVLMNEGDSSKCGPKSTKCFAFRVPTSFASALQDAGFDVMSIANNHTGDFGQAGRERTIEALDLVSITHSGPVGDLATLEARGLRIGLVAFSTGGGVYRVQDIETARKVVADLDREHDLVIVSFHGGAEGSLAARVPKRIETFYGENRGNVYAFAHAVVDAGADLVLGHGPHRLRGMEIYRGRFIAYSLGNFSTWNTFSLAGPLGITTIVRVTLAPNGVVTAAEMVPVKIIGPGRPQPDPTGKAIRIVRDLSRKDFGSPLFDTRGTWERPAPVSARASSRPPGR